MNVNTLHKICESLRARNMGTMPVAILKESVPETDSLSDGGVVANIQDYFYSAQECVDSEGNLRRSPRGSTISKNHFVLTAWKTK